MNIKNIQKVNLIKNGIIVLCLINLKIWYWCIEEINWAKINRGIEETKWEKKIIIKKTIRKYVYYR